MDADTLEKIAAAVHRSWTDEKVRQGFADHVLDPKPTAETFTGSDGGLFIGTVTSCARCPLYQDKHHADMLPYADLAENVREYDRATVRAVLAGIEAAGLMVVPVLPPHPRGKPAASLTLPASESTKELERVPY